jgi:hypothetical protein
MVVVILIGRFNSFVSVIDHAMNLAGTVIEVQRIVWIFSQIVCC